MYCSLNRIDLLIKEREGQVAVQTDHRSASEIEESGPLGLVMAACRVRSPRFLPEVVRVQLSHAEPPPAGYLALVTAGGADVEVLQRSFVPAAPDDAAFEQGAFAALEAVALATYRSFAAPLRADGLTSLLLMLRDEAGSGPEADELAWWSAVLRLGAATGQLVRSMYGGEWRFGNQFSATVPFYLDIEGVRVNVFGKAERFLQHGESETPLQLLTALRDRKAPDGPPMIRLRPPDWGGAEIAACRRLLDVGPPVRQDLPWVALVYDLPETTRAVPASLPPETLRGLWQAAAENLGRVQVRAQTLQFGDVRIWAYHGDFYTSEKLLDLGWLLERHRELGDRRLFAAIPVIGWLYLTPSSNREIALATLHAVVDGHLEGVAAPQRLTDALFVVEGGQLRGTVSLKTPGS